MIKPEQVRGLLDEVGLSQRGAAKHLEISDRTMRRYCCMAGDGAPRVVELELKQMKAERVS